MLKTTTPGRGPRSIAAAALALLLWHCGDGGPTPPTPGPVSAQADCGGTYGPSSLGRPVQFDGSGSTTPNPPLTYLWTFGDDTTDTALTPTHTYSYCNYLCSGPTCNQACLNATGLPYSGCCPEVCEGASGHSSAPVLSNLPCARQEFLVTLTVTDAKGASDRCETTFIGTGMY